MRTDERILMTKMQEIVADNFSHINIKEIIHKSLLNFTLNVHVCKKHTQKTHTFCHNVGGVIIRPCISKFFNV